MQFTRKLIPIMVSVFTCALMVFPISVFAAGSQGPSESNKYYNSTTHFMHEGTNYTCSKTKYSYNSRYTLANDKYYMTDSCGTIQKNSSGTVRGYTVNAYTEKRNGLQSIFVNSPLASPSSSEVYAGSGKLSCSVTANAGFPLGTASNYVTGTSSFCSVYESFNRSGQCTLSGTVKSEKAKGSGTISLSVSAY